MHVGGIYVTNRTLTLYTAHSPPHEGPHTLQTRPPACAQRDVQLAQATCHKTLETTHRHHTRHARVPHPHLDHSKPRTGPAVTGPTHSVRSDKPAGQPSSTPITACPLSMPPTRTKHLYAALQGPSQGVGPRTHRGSLRLHSNT